MRVLIIWYPLDLGYVTLLLCLSCSLNGDLHMDDQKMNKNAAGEQGQNKCQAHHEGCKGRCKLDQNHDSQHQCEACHQAF